MEDLDHTSWIFYFNDTYVNPFSRLWHTGYCIITFNTKNNGTFAERVKCYVYF